MIPDKAVNVKQANVDIVQGNLTVDIFNVPTGGAAFYTQAFTNQIVNGTWSVLLGKTQTLNLNYSQVYWRDYTINGVDVDFRNNTGDIVERLEWTSNFGDIDTNNITTGIFPIARGGTNAGDASSARGNLSASANGTCTTAGQFINATTPFGITCGTPASNGGSATTTLPAPNVTGGMFGTGDFQFNGSLNVSLNQIFRANFTFGTFNTTTTICGANTVVNSINQTATGSLSVGCIADQTAAGGTVVQNNYTQVIIFGGQRFANLGTTSLNLSGNLFDLSNGNQPYYLQYRTICTGSLASGQTGMITFLIQLANASTGNGAILSNVVTNTCTLAGSATMFISNTSAWVAIPAQWRGNISMVVSAKDTASTDDPILGVVAMELRS